MKNSRRDTEITALRHRLHAAAELSGAERRTAGIITAYLEKQKPARLITGLGGFGVAAVYEGARPGRAVLLRADIDALPLADPIKAPYRARGNAAHKCGHDGHAAALCAVARALRQKPLPRGRAVLLFQPAEEVLAGAASVLADPKFAPLRPDIVFGLHNFPGFPLGAVLLKKGVMCRATAGFVFDFKGRVAHASEPEKGLNPAAAMAEIILEAHRCPRGITGAKLTVVGVNAGGPHFGTSPGTGSLMLTLRAETSAGLNRLAARCEKLALAAAKKHGLALEISVTDACPETLNRASAAAAARTAAQSLGLKTADLAESFPTAEDFGCFTKQFPGALLGIGAGENQAPLHSAEYDYPDALLAPSALLLETLARGLV